MRHLIIALLFVLPIHLFAQAEEELDERLKAVMMLFDKKHEELNAKVEQLETESQDLKAENAKLIARNQALVAENKSLRNQLGLKPEKQIETAATPRDLEALQTYKSKTGEGADSSEQINVNKASISELETLPGVGPVIAQRIVDNRPYAVPDDLLRVRGIGKTSIEILRPLIRVE